MENGTATAAHYDHSALSELLEEIIASMPGFITGYLSSHPRRRRRSSRLVEESHQLNHSLTRTEIGTDLDGLSTTTYLPSLEFENHVHFASFRRPPAAILKIWQLPSKEIDEKFLKTLNSSSNSCVRFALKISS